MKSRTSPVAGVASLVFVAASLVLFVAFKQAYQLRYYVGGEGMALLDSLLRVLAGELVFTGAALLVAIWGLVRREGVMAWIAAGLAVVNLLARAAFM